MSESKFACNSCNFSFEDRSSLVNCRICGDLCCLECVNDSGECVPCIEEKQIGLMSGEAAPL